MIEPKEDLISSPQAQSIERVAWSGVRAYATCYCCHGTGYVVRVERVLLSPHTFTRPILCKRLGCTASSKVPSNPSIVDTRLTPTECQELHELGLADWQTADRNWHEQRQQALLLSLSEKATKKL